MISFQTCLKIIWHVLVVSQQTLFLFFKMYYNVEIKINLSLEEGALHRFILVSPVLLEDGSVNCSLNTILCKPHFTFASYLSPLED